MQLDLLDQGPPLMEADIQKLEKQLGCPLPVAYRDFMLAHNGGEPKSQTRFTLQGVDWRLEWLFTIDFEGKAASLPYAAKHNRDYLPKCLLPIGQIETSHMLAIGIMGCIRDQVFVLTDDAAFHADSPASEVARDAGVVRVSEDFAAFVRGLL